MSNFLGFSPLTQGAAGPAPTRATAYTADNLATVTATGYVNDKVALGQLQPGDIIELNYSYIESPESYTTGQFQVVFSTPNYNLSQLDISASAVTYTGSLVSGNFPKLSGTTGVVVDSGISPSDATKTKAVMANSATVAGCLAVFSDTAGTIDDTGSLTPISTTVSYGGGSATPTITVPGSLTTSKYSVQINASTNAVSVQKVTQGVGNCVLLLSGDPGAGTVFTVVGFL